ncbi:ABC-F family ATP-binding cassette domain-containing protein [Clostridium estertheticum]|uniref:ABC-F family ATP-binding cassette domain-containing protein n=1 Tax=Clostridium estertheticum TaxID=238834 RepID=UPI001CF30885|nr:ABC-F family ATP-binding cassette domain-containing protein [Clostridium estertheticum]MCB2361845.1 ATP-binding cassette domain-containing protein [Clostridium estertheticum]
MSILVVKNMSHGFGDRVIFEDVSFRLLKGEHIALIGANGEGKSTFMNIITGKLMPDEGDVEWSNNVRVGYMDQHTVLEKGKSIRDVLRDAFKYLFDLEEEMLSVTEKMAETSPEELERLLDRMGTIQDQLDNNGFYGIDSKIDEVAAGVGLKDVGLDNDVAELSGGQRTKVLLAKLLLEAPDVLLLDEPTNFLDEQHVEWLKRYLQNYDKAFILISHDIEFLDGAINIIYHVENKKLTRYIGSYDEFLRVHEAKRLQMESDYERQQKEITRLEVFVAKNKARASTSGMAKSRQKKLDKIDRMEIVQDKPKPQFNFKTARASGKIIFKTKELVTGYDTPLSKPLDLYMERGQKIALTGANGVGKTTLLKSLMGDIKALSGHTNLGDYQYIGYYEQEIKGVNRNNCIEEFWQEFPSFTQGQVRSALAKCGLTTKHIESKVTVLSGGEQAKVRLAKLLNRETNILILDEPTNHLDVDAKDELKRALKEYNGSILLVCHEPEFYQDVVTDVWDCEEWTTKII